jgi:hypothetical protein
MTDMRIFVFNKSIISHDAAKLVGVIEHFGAEGLVLFGYAVVGLP